MAGPRIDRRALSLAPSSGVVRLALFLGIPGATERTDELMTEIERRLAPPAAWPPPKYERDRE